MLGAGGMGVVYQARDLLHELMGEPDPCIAIKVLNDDLATARDADALLYSEFALTRRLHHPHIVRSYAFGVDDECNQAFMTLEFMRGVRLDRVLNENPGGLPWAQAREIATVLLDALTHVHEKGVLHGDVKPENIMLTERGLRLFDFGLGQPVEGVLTGLPQLNRQRLQPWTPRYAAPEVRDGGPLTTQADVYAVAAVLYEMVAGKEGRASSIPVESHLSRRASQRRKPSALPSACWSALRMALMSDVRDRATNAHQMLEAFQQASGGLFRRWF
ncbi:serine/threonine-protein kinase [Pseudomonas viridiflava]|uniref:serine/threonine-protein kinase n=2 Tax=Pseudomonas viridiflava TaxID=33069 RepID=UPI001F11C975